LAPATRTVSSASMCVSAVARNNGIARAGTSVSMPDPTTSRQSMVESQLRARGISDPRVLDTMLRVPRHQFVPETYRSEAYEDHPLPIGDDQPSPSRTSLPSCSSLSSSRPLTRFLKLGRVPAMSLPCWRNLPGKCSLSNVTQLSPTVPVKFSLLSATRTSKFSLETAQSAFPPPLPLTPFSSPLPLLICPWRCYPNCATPVA